MPCDGTQPIYFVVLQISRYKYKPKVSYCNRIKTYIAGSRNVGCVGLVLHAKMTRISYEKLNKLRKFEKIIYSLLQYLLNNVHFINTPIYLLKIIISFAYL